MRKIEASGLYIIKDEYFSKFPNPKYMDNKGERRPHYYAVRDNDGLFWMIPISSKVDKFKAKIAEVEEKSGTGNCFLFAIAPVSGRERAFIISEMFPVTEEYILRPYTVGGTPLVIQNEEIQKTIKTKALRFLKMVNKGYVKSPLNILSIKKKLLRELEDGTGSRRPC